MRSVCRAVQCCMPTLRTAAAGVRTGWQLQAGWRKGRGQGSSWLVTVHLTCMSSALPSCVKRLLLHHVAASAFQNGSPCALVVLAEWLFQMQGALLCICAQCVFNCFTACAAQVLWAEPTGLLLPVWWVALETCPTEAPAVAQLNGVFHQAPADGNL
jgi:hypothetical protein